MIWKLIFLPIVSASILEQFKEKGIEYELYGKGRLVPEKQHCVPFNLDLLEYVNTWNTNEMTEYEREVLKKRIYASFETICNTFNITTDITATPSSTAFSFSPSRINVMLTDNYEIALNFLDFEIGLKRMLLEHRITQPFLEVVPEEFIKKAGSEKEDFLERTNIFPLKCNVRQLNLEAKLCYNISETPQTGVVYSIIHGGEFLHDDEVFAYYEVPKHVLITAQDIYPIDFAQCKVSCGPYINCFQELKTQCDVSTLSDCPIMARKVEDDFIFQRPFGYSRLKSIVATTNIEYDLLQNGTKLAVPGQIFTLRVLYNINPDAEEMVKHVDLKEHTVETRMFPDMLPETINVLTDSESTRLYITQKRGTPMLSHKHFDQGAWDAVRRFFDRFI